MSVLTRKQVIAFLEHKSCLKHQYECCDLHTKHDELYSEEGHRYPCHALAEIKRVAEERQCTGHHKRMHHAPDPNVFPCSVKSMGGCEHEHQHVERQEGNAEPCVGLRSVENDINAARVVAVVGE